MHPTLTRYEERVDPNVMNILGRLATTLYRISPLCHNLNFLLTPIAPKFSGEIKRKNINWVRKDEN